MSEPTKPILPPQVRAYLAHASKVVETIPRPVRILIIATAVVALSIAIWIGVRSAYEPYGVLFTQLDRDDAGAIVTKLKELKIPYRVGEVGDTIEVPLSRVHEVRLDLASSGLPRGGHVGFESFDTMRLGATEFEQRVLYRRAMEGELARTIGSIDGVKSARVHLVLPEKSVFAARREPASASVVVKLRGGRFLGQAEVAGIIHLVAAAVPSLSPDQVSLVTTEGITLHRPRPPGKEGAEAPAENEQGSPLRDADTIREAEATYEERARAMLERVLGPGHVDVRVSADMDLARLERVEDHYDPATDVLRSEEQTIERAGTPNDETVAGVPGAESNLPMAKPQAAGSAAVPVPTATITPAPSSAPMAAGAVVRESHTRNFEIDHIHEKRVRTSGIVKRLTVAVAVDGVPGTDPHVMVPRDRAALDKIASLVRGAVGIDEWRGDVVTVESVPFLDSEAHAEQPVISSWKVPPELAKYKKYWPYAAGALGLIVLVALVRARIARRRRAKKLAAETAIAEAAAAEAAALAAAAKAPELAAEAENLKLPGALTPAEQRAEAVRRAKDDPATAALVVRRWLGTTTAET